VAPALVPTATLNPQAVTFRERVGIPTAINNLADTCLSQRPLAGFSYLQDALKLSFFPWKSGRVRQCASTFYSLFMVMLPRSVLGLKPVVTHQRSRDGYQPRRPTTTAS
jgi:hypothetical protein